MKYRNVTKTTLHLYDGRFVGPNEKVAFEVTEEEVDRIQKLIDTAKIVLDVNEMKDIENLILKVDKEPEYKEEVEIESKLENTLVAEQQPEENISQLDAQIEAPVESLIVEEKTLLTEMEVDSHSTKPNSETKKSNSSFSDLSLERKSISKKKTTTTQSK